MLSELVPRCEEASRVRLVLNAAGSSQLSRQIEAARAADLFLSADEHWMDRLSSKGLVDEVSRRPLVSNRLVVVVRHDSPLRIERPDDLAGPDVRRLSLADPRGVPAGRYSRSWLERAGVWELVRNRVVPALDVRAAMAAVEHGAADAGVVYATNAAVSTKVRVAYEVAEEEGPEISYPIAAMAGRPHLMAAREVVDCLASRGSMEVFDRHGFVTEKAGETHSEGGPP